MIVWRDEIWEKTVELMFTVQTICNQDMKMRSGKIRVHLPARLAEDICCGDGCQINA